LLCLIDKMSIMEEEVNQHFLATKGAFDLDVANTINCCLVLPGENEQSEEAVQ
jgi:hypothetical protein